MGNTEYFELCETSSKIQCSDCALSWDTAHAANTCSLQKRIDSLNKARYDVLSMPGYVIKKNPTHGARHGPSVRQCMNCKAHDMLRKARKDGTMMTNTASLCQILGGLRNRSFNMMQSQWKIIPTWLHGKKAVGTENPGKILCMQKAFKDHSIGAVT